MSKPKADTDSKSKKRENKVNLAQLFPNGYPTTVLELVLALGGGMIPETGEYTLRLWGVFLGTGKTTVDGYRKQYQIPYRLQGKEIYIDAVDFRRCVPKCYWDQQQE